MAKHSSNDGLQQAPLITPGSLARVLNVGTNTIRSAAERAGIVIPRFANNRDYMSFDQAVAIRHELTSNR